MRYTTKDKKLQNKFRNLYLFQTFVWSPELCKKSISLFATALSGKNSSGKNFVTSKTFRQFYTQFVGEMTRWGNFLQLPKILSFSPTIFSPIR